MLNNAKSCPTKNMDREIRFNATYMTINGKVQVGNLYVHTDDNLTIGHTSMVVRKLFSGQDQARSWRILNAEEEI